jgi:hypothetical protein
MSSCGVFGYIIGKKTFLTNVNYDANLLWQILVREIFILMKHYGSLESLKKVFKSIKIPKKDPTEKDVEKCKFFTNYETSLNYENTLTWESLLYYCQHSYINMIESGYILNKKEKEEFGYIFLLDFNKSSVSFDFKKCDGTIKHCNTATISEIMEFEDMPINILTDILREMKEDYLVWYEKYLVIKEGLVNLEKLKQEVKKQGAVNIEEKINKSIYNLKCQQNMLYQNRRVFYNRLEALNLIEEDKEDRE